jgi:hypothetical protein
VYCRATCGQNIHKECFEMWAATKHQTARDAVTCPMCRSPWQGDEDMVKKIKNTGTTGTDGYVNVADQLGMSRVRGMKIPSTLICSCFACLLTFIQQTKAPITTGPVVVKDTTDLTVALGMSDVAKHRIGYNMFEPCLAWPRFRVYSSRGQDLHFVAIGLQRQSSPLHTILFVALC